MDAKQVGKISKALGDSNRLKIFLICQNKMVAYNAKK